MLPAPPLGTFDADETSSFLRFVTVVSVFVELGVPPKNRSIPGCDIQTRSE
jgi:hypothetical protein